MRAYFVERANAYLRYHDLPGCGPARVYLPGLGGGSSSSFPPLASQTALAGYRSLLIDPLGFGYSDRPRDYSYSLEDHARAVADLLDHIGLTGYAVFGASWGGSIAIALATLRPDLVGRLVLAEANLEPGPQEGTNAQGSRSIAAYSEQRFLEAGYEKIMAGIRQSNPELAGEIQVATDPLAIHRSAVSLVVGTQPTLRESLIRMTIPRVYVFGELTLQNADMAERAEDLPKRGVRVLIVPGVDHGMGIDDNPAGLADVLRMAFEE